MRKLSLYLAILWVAAFAMPLYGDDTPVKDGSVTDASVSRLPALPDPTDPYLKDMFAKIRARGGEPLNIHLVQGFAPALAKARLDMAYALRYDVVTSPLLRELAILRTGQILHSDYELDQHVPIAKSCGVTDPQIAALPDWRASELFDEKQRALLAYTEALDTHGGDVDDATYAAFAKQFTPRKSSNLRSRS